MKTLLWLATFAWVITGDRWLLRLFLVALIYGTYRLMRWAGV